MIFLIAYQEKLVKNLVKKYKKIKKKQKKKCLKWLKK